MNNDTNYIANQVKDKGFLSINNFLGSENLSAIDKILNHKKLKGKESSFPVFYKQYLVKFLKADFKSIKKSFILKRVAKTLELKSIAEKIFDSDVELHQIDSYYSEKSEKDILTWHNDIGLKGEKFQKWFYDESKATIKNSKNKVSARGIKFFIYLTDVQSDNGCLGVIPYSNKIVKELTSLILENKIDLKPYWNLKDLRNLVADSKNKKLISQKLGEELVDDFLKNSSFIENENGNSFKYDLEMKKGSTVIFDELCVHRGSAPKLNSRIVLRYFYRKK